MSIVGGNFTCTEDNGICPIGMFRNIAGECKPIDAVTAVSDKLATKQTAAKPCLNTIEYCLNNPTHATDTSFCNANGYFFNTILNGRTTQKCVCDTTYYPFNWTAKC